MGAEKHPTVGSSGEYWSMNENLNQHFAEMKDLKIVKAMIAVKFNRKLKTCLHLKRTSGQQRASSCGKTLTRKRYWPLLGVKSD